MAKFSNPETQSLHELRRDLDKAAQAFQRHAEAEVRDLLHREAVEAVRAAQEPARTLVEQYPPSGIRRWIR